MAKDLLAAGGAAGAKSGSKEFLTEWHKLAKEQPQKFFDAQHQFIKQTHYDKQAAALKSSFDIDLDKRSHALQNVVWSMAVQHNNGTKKIFENALNGRKASTLSDRDLIKALYTERSKVDKYFSKSTPAVKESVKKRFELEERAAIKLLEKEKP
jgi:hypothetical protein